MAITTTFDVRNELPGQTMDHVLVFLKPLRASPNFQYYAWRDLNPPMSGFQDFLFTIDLSVNVFNPDSGVTSTTESINPGELFSAINPNGQGPYLSTANINTGQITSSQAGVINLCDSPFIRIGLNWYNTGQLVVTAGSGVANVINNSKIVTLEFEPTLYFMAAEPTVIGPNFTLQDYSSMTPYTLKAGITNVTVHWTRPNGNNGEDVFVFEPPSAVIGR